MTPPKNEPAAVTAAESPEVLKRRQRQELDEARQALENSHDKLYAHRTGGTYHIVGGERVHESKLTEDQKSTLGLLSSKTAE